MILLIWLFVGPGPGLVNPNSINLLECKNSPGRRGVLGKMLDLQARGREFKYRQRQAGIFSCHYFAISVLALLFSFNKHHSLEDILVLHRRSITNNELFVNACTHIHTQTRNCTKSIHFIFKRAHTFAPSITESLSLHYDLILLAWFETIFVLTKKIIWQASKSIPEPWVTDRTAYQLSWSECRYY